MLHFRMNWTPTSRSAPTPDYPQDLRARKAANSAQFWCNVSPFRMNTCKSVSKQRTLTPFRMNTYEKYRGEGGAASLARSALRGVLLLTTHPMRMRILSERSESKDLSSDPIEDVCPERPTGAEGSLRVAQPFLAVLFHQSPLTDHRPGPCTLPLRPAILDGHPMKRHGNNFSDPILSSPRPGRSQHRKETLFTSHESRVTSHQSRITSHEPCLRT
jgi:hypothetical protein